MSKKLKSAVLIYSTAFLTASIGCGEKVEYVYNIVPSQHLCFKYKITDKKALKFDPNGETIPWENCPPVFGFNDEDTPKVINYVKRELKNCGN